MHTVTVLNYDGTLLAGCSPKRARKLMKAKKARPVRYNGHFAIQLNKKAGERCNMPLQGGKQTISWTPSG